MKISRIIKKIPRIKRFLNFHNPGIKQLIENVGILSIDNPLIIDVGANTGQTIELIFSLNKKSEIYSFEPTAKLATYLKSKYKNFSNVHIFDLAISDELGESDLYTSEFSATNSLLAPDVNLYQKFNNNLSTILSATEKMRCKVSTLDNWYKENIPDMRNIDLLKIDTQGTEYNVLKGAKDILHSRVKSVIVEFQYISFYLNSQPFYKIIEILYENGYYLFSFFENNKKTNLQLIENNALFLNKSFFSESL